MLQVKVSLFVLLIYYQNNRSPQPKQTRQVSRFCVSVCFIVYLGSWDCAIGVAVSFSHKTTTFFVGETYAASMNQRPSKKNQNGAPLPYLASRK